MAADRQRSRGVVAAVVVVAVAVGGLVLPRLVGDRSSGNRPANAAQPSAAAVLEVDPVSTSSPPATDTAGSSVAVASPTASTFGVPVGYPQSPAGVRASAVAWVSSLGELLRLGPIARDEALRALLSRRAFGETVEEFRSERDRFRDQFGRDVSQAVWRDAPLTVQIVSAAATRAEVEVWSVLLFGTTGDRVEMLWRTHSVTLVWEDEAWRVDDVVRRDGPTPVLAAMELPSEGAEFDPVIGWPAAVLAGTSVG